MKPLAFSRPMVLARRAGRKTQTRRLARIAPDAQIDNLGDGETVLNLTTGEELRCPIAQPGDRLWVREDFQVLHRIGPDASRRLAVRYLADNVPADVTLTEHELTLWNKRQFPYRSTPGRFMYQSLARDKPTLLSVRLERIQDITEAVAIAEGCYRMDNGLFAGPPHKVKGTPLCCTSPTIAFQMLWESIHGPESWTANPWVWVLELTPFTP
jgi:hypothetical protein